MALELSTKIVNKPNYESTVIVTPNIEEAEAKDVVNKFVKMIKDAKGEVINVEHWGKRQLAYPINHKTSGYYAYVEFKSFPEFISKLEQEFIYDESIIRYLTVKLEKHSLAYNDKRRKLRADKKNEENN